MSSRPGQTQPSFLYVFVFVVGTGVARDRDRRGAADGPLLRGLDAGLGEHDRRRAARAQPRLLARRQARRPQSRSSRACAGWCWSPRSCWRSSRSSPSRCSTSRSTRSIRSRPAPSSARCSASCCWSRSRSPCSAPPRPYAIRLAVGAVERLGPRRGPALRGLDGRLAARHLALGPAADPLRWDAAHLPDLRRRGRAGRRRRPRPALPGGAGGAGAGARRSGRHPAGGRGRQRCCSRPRPSSSSCR